MQKQIKNIKMSISLRKAFNVADEYFTPKILVNILEPYIKLRHTKFINTEKREPVFWCPFDTENSEFCIFLKEHNYKYIYTHLSGGQDFFDIKPEYDIAISNPPFSKKINIFNRLFELKKPFAMVMNMMIINYQNIGDLFIDKNIQLLIPNKKVSFNGSTSAFNSGYICCDFLPSDLIFCKIDNTNVGKHFVPSRMYKDLKNKIYETGNDKLRKK